MAETRTLSERYAEMGQRLIDTEPALACIRDNCVTIVYLASDAARKSHGRATLGTCELVPAKWKWGVPADYAITVYEPNCQGMTNDQLSTLLFHELLHIDIDRDKDGAEVYRIRPHDLEDFRAIVDRFGADWGDH